jgi:hypothetical protein
MPPSEIYLDRGAQINAFDNTFVTFDDGIQRFDEEGTPRDLPEFTGFDETTATGFDNTLTTFDEGL